MISLGLFLFIFGICLVFYGFFVRDDTLSTWSLVLGMIMHIIGTVIVCVFLEHTVKVKGCNVDIVDTTYLITKDHIDTNYIIKIDDNIINTPEFAIDTTFFIHDKQIDTTYNVSYLKPQKE